MKPIRIQRQRVKGWRAPENTVSVTRPGKWGNPYKDVEIALALKLFEDSARGFWNPSILGHLSDGEVATIYNLHCAWSKRFGTHPTEAIRVELRGKNLMCFCPLDQPCHADVLLKIANGE